MKLIVCVIGYSIVTIRLFSHTEQQATILKINQKIRC